MMRFRLFIGGVTLLAAVIAVGCTATGQVFQKTAPKPGGAVIYVYRPSVFCLSARSTQIAVDMVRVGDLRNSGYLPIWVDPGTHTVYAVGPDDKLYVNTPVQVGVGEEVFVRWTPTCTELANGMKFEVEIVPVDPAVAQQEIQGKRLSQ